MGPVNREKPRIVLQSWFSIPVHPVKIAENRGSRVMPWSPALPSPGLNTKFSRNHTIHVEKVLNSFIRLLTIIKYLIYSDRKEIKVFEIRKDLDDEHAA